MNRTLTLPVSNRRVGDVGDIDEESFCWLNIYVAIYRDVELISLLAARDRLVGLRVGNVIITGSSGRVVLGGNVEGDPALRRR